MKIQTSLWFSKKLNDAGFKGESSNSYYSVPLDNEEKRRFIFGNEQRIGYVKHEIREGNEFYQDLIPAYDILNDLCVKYKLELFGDDWVEITQQIFDLRQVGLNDESEKYLWENCVLFNK